MSLKSKKDIFSKNLNTVKFKNEQNNKVLKFNQKNLEDLDALYFYDKVEMNPKKSLSIPKIIIKPREDINDEEDEEEYEEEDEREKLLKRSNSNEEFIGVSDLKFTSSTFIKVRQAFI